MRAASQVRARYAPWVSISRIQASEPSAATRHLSRVGALDLHWTEAGSGRPTVFLHGVCDSHRTWNKVVPALAGSRRLLMPDLPGHGLSDRPDAPYTVEWYAGVISAWIDALGLKSFDLVAHSFGGGVAQMLLLSHGARVGRLALVGSGGLGPEVAYALRLWAALRFAERASQRFIAPGTRLALARMLPGADPEDVAFMSWMNSMPGTGRALSRTVRAAIGWRGQKLQFLDRPEQLPRPLPRIALFWGDRDQIIPLAHAQELVARMDHVDLTRFAACGHWPQQEQPEAFAAALERFLDAPLTLRARLRDVQPAARIPRWKRWLRALSIWRGIGERLAGWVRLGRRKSADL